MLGRFRAWYQDEGYSVDVIQAVLARRPTSPSDFDKRVSAVAEFSKLDAAAALAAANKRVANILAKVSDDIPEQVSTNLLQEPAGMRAVIDSFFDQVMVNADDNAVRFNRLALLKQLRELFLQVADISVLQ